MEPPSIFTIGHSTLSYERFAQIVRDVGVTAIADVRSAPYSRYFDHFNRETLQAKLRADNIAYVFLGDSLGGRPKDSRYFREGVADYEKMADAPGFKEGIDRVIEGVARHRIALMCSEHDPLDCHRCLLIGRVLNGRKISVGHILSSGRHLSHEQIEE